MTFATMNADSQTGNAVPVNEQKSKSVSLAKSRGFRLGILAAIVLALEFIVFRSYFYGSSIPPWDFLGSYNTDAYLWWTNGSFFDPIEWVPNVWGGYPAALILQNSGWYLPVGLVAAIIPFSLHASAALSAVHVAFGFVGVYALARSLKLRFGISTLLAVAWFFGVAYFSNAEHVDIVRGYAWIPWVLLVLSPRWPWRRVWGIPLAAVVLWQATTGMYPGMVFATCYVALVWVITWQLVSRERLRRFLIPLGVAAISAVLLSAPRLVPYFLYPSDAASGLPETSVFSVNMLGTLLFGYGSPELENDISMRSFFVPATILVLAFFARWRHLVTKLAVALIVPALLLGMPFFPWADLVQSLPGLGLSRFTMSDFKPFLIFGLLLLAASGLFTLLSARRSLPLRPDTWIRIVGALAVLVGLALIGWKGPFSLQEWAPQIVLLGIVLVVVVLWRLTPRSRRATSFFTSVLIVLTAVSGTLWAYGTTAPWKAPRVATETATFGAPVSDLIAADTGESSSVQRPGRLPLPDGFTEAELFGGGWNRVYYTGELAIGGYINLKGSQTQRMIVAGLLDPESGSEFAAFMALPGTVLTVPQGQEFDSASLRACVTENDCGAATVEPKSYSPGRFEYEVEAQTEQSAVLNEAYFPGWEASACFEGERCEQLAVGASPTGLVQLELPSGSYTLELNYHTPGREIAWVLFWFGAGLCLGSMIWLLGRRAFTTRRGSVT